ncbi:MAG: hypothetical protein ACOC1K_07105 [Nanoarchaeota archaeon]
MILENEELPKNSKFFSPEEIRKKKRTYKKFKKRNKKKYLKRRNGK